MRKLFTFLLALAASVCASYAAPAVAVNGKLPWAFSVSPTKVVYFSQGNLQYKASPSPGEWRFAENQYDAVGGNNGFGSAAPYNTSSANHSPSASQTGWIDLFGWAASGISRTGVNAYQPYSTSTTHGDYGTTTTKSASETLGDYDWGKNMGDGWRTLTAEEWEYLIGPGNGGTTPSAYRANYQSLRGLCYITVSGTSYPGLIILPDDMYDNLPSEGDIATKWSACAVAAGSSLQYTNATFTEEEWTALQAAGAVFLPAAGFRSGTSVYYAGAGGYYWSSSASSDINAFNLYFGAGSLGPEYIFHRYGGVSVRLVSDIAPIVNYTITFKNYDGTTLQSGEVVKGTTPSYTGTTPVKPSTAAYSYTFSGWSPTIVAATADATYTAQYNQAPNQATVDDVIAKINAIGEVAYTPECKDKIDVARNAYNALTYEQKALVSNYATLTAVEARYAYLTPVVITPNEDPKNAGTYYSTYYDGNRLLMLPENVEAYAASISGNALALELIAEAGETLPAATAVILRSTVTPFTLLPQDDGAVDLTAVENDLQGVDAETAIADKVSGTCYVLSGKAKNDPSIVGVGFYKYLAPSQLQAHKAFVDLGSAPTNAPQRLRFVFGQEKVATAIDNTDASAKLGGSEKRLEDGRLVIIRDGVRYNAQGQILK